MQDSNLHQIQTCENTSKIILSLHGRDKLNDIQCSKKKHIKIFQYLANLTFLKKAPYFGQAKNYDSFMDLIMMGYNT